MTAAIGDSAASYLADVAVERAIGFKSTKITDDGLSFLRKMQTIRSVGLEGPFSDKAVVHLERLKQLRDVSFVNTNVSEAGFGRLRDSLPLTRILCDGRRVFAK